MRDFIDQIHWTRKDVLGGTFSLSFLYHAWFYVDGSQWVLGVLEY
jgi:hypothetical protein